MNTLVVVMVVKASLLIGAAALVNTLLRRRTSAATRHLVWTLALTGVLLLPVLSVVVPAWGIPIHVRTADPASPATSNAAPAEDNLGEAGATAAALTTVEAAGSWSAASTSAAPAPRASFLKDLSWTSIGLALYLLGAVVLALRLAMGRWTLRRLVRESAEVADPSWRSLLRECESQMGVSRPVRLLRSLDRNMPMAFGVRTPTILIPAIADTWTEDRRRAVLLHELAHIDRRDCFTQLVAEVTCAAYWMHPGVWWVARCLRVERELACDDRVLSVGTAARDYAGHLLELAYSLGGYRSPALVVSMARPRQLEGRMLAVLDAARNRVTPTLRARVIGVAAATAMILPLAAVEAVVVSASPKAPDMEDSWVSLAPVAPMVPVASLGPLEPQGSTRPVTRSSQATPVPSASATKDGRERTREIKLPGTWEVRTSEQPGMVYLQLSERPHSQHGSTIALDQLDGLTPSMLSDGSGPAKFNVRRDAGTIAFDGVFRSGVGAGTFDFVPSPTFGAEMVKRGFESPTATEQYQLARGNVGFAYLDELKTQKYDTPTLAELVRAADHGVHLEYLRGMGAAGYRLGQISALIRTRDHGVTPAYVSALAAEGFKNLTAEQLVHARDHGITPQYLGTMRAFGYGGLTPEELTKARDHGVSADYIREMAEAGHARLPLTDLVRARDHGVTADYVKAMRDSGYGALTLDELMRARSHGVSSEFVRGMLSLGPERPSIEELINARDHGVGPEFVKAWRDLGYPATLADMVRARDHGVSAEYIKEMKGLGYDRLPIDDLIRLKDHGVSVNFVRDQNSGARSRLTVEELVRRRNGRM